MIKVVETVTFPDGRMSSSEKEFVSKKFFVKMLKSSAVDGKVAYELKKHDEAIIDYADARVHMKIIDLDAKDQATEELKEHVVGDRREESNP